MGSLTLGALMCHVELNVPLVPRLLLSLAFWMHRTATAQETLTRASFPMVCGRLFSKTTV